MNNSRSLPPLLPNKVIEKAKSLNTTVIADVINNKGVMNYQIKSVTSQSKMCGTAITVSLRSGDNLFLHHAIYLATKGYIIVVDGGGHLENAYLGELMAYAARARDIDGIIIDGLVRDKEELAKLDFPIFAKGFIPSGPLKNGPGEINQPISCGGAAVRPGDLIVADDDGVVVVRKEDVDVVLEKAEKKLKYEQRRIEQINAFNRDSDDIESLMPEWLPEKIAPFLRD